jgi:hypothetical protein
VGIVPALLQQFVDCCNGYIIDVVVLERPGKYQHPNISNNANEKWSRDRPGYWLLDLGM